MGKTVFVIFVLFAGALSFGQITRQLLIWPIERMVPLVLFSCSIAAPNLGSFPDEHCYNACKEPVGKYKAHPDGQVKSWL
jgi:hypothetical protein